MDIKVWPNIEDWALTDIGDKPHCTLLEVGRLAALLLLCVCGVSELGVLAVCNGPPSLHPSASQLAS